MHRACWRGGRKGLLWRDHWFTLSQAPGRRGGSRQDRDGPSGVIHALGRKDVVWEESVRGDRAAALSSTGSRRGWHGGAPAPRGAAFGLQGVMRTVCAGQKRTAVLPPSHGHSPTVLVCSSSASPGPPLRHLPVPAGSSHAASACGLHDPILQRRLAHRALCIYLFCWGGRVVQLLRPHTGTPPPAPGPEHRGRRTALGSLHSQMLPFPSSWAASSRLRTQLDASPLDAPPSRHVLGPLGPPQAPLMLA